MAAATGLASVDFAADLPLDCPDSLFFVSLLPAESPFEEESEELSLDDESPELPEEESSAELLSAEAAVSRWRLRVP